MELEPPRAQPDHEAADDLAEWAVSHPMIADRTGSAACRSENVAEGLAATE